MPTRRSFPFATSPIAAGSLSHLAALAPTARLQESDAQAAALGYRHSGEKVDKAKYPKFAASQKCSNCALYQGKAGDTWGACAIFPGKQVNANGWCSAWAKQAG